MGIAHLHGLVCACATMTSLFRGDCKCRCYPRTRRTPGFSHRAVGKTSGASSTAPEIDLVSRSKFLWSRPEQGGQRLPVHPRLWRSAKYTRRVADTARDAPARLRKNTCRFSYLIATRVHRGSRHPTASNSLERGITSTNEGRSVMRKQSVKEFARGPCRARSSCGVSCAIFGSTPN